MSSLQDRFEKRRQKLLKKEPVLSKLVTPPGVAERQARVAEMLDKTDLQAAKPKQDLKG